jgi:hypothetical protein
MNYSTCFDNIFAGEEREKVENEKQEHWPIFIFYVFMLTPAANLPPLLLTALANLPPVSTFNNTIGKLVVKVAAGVVDTSGKFDDGVFVTGDAP